MVRPVPIPMMAGSGRRSQRSFPPAAAWAMPRVRGTLYPGRSAQRRRNANRSEFSGPRTAPCNARSGVEVENFDKACSRWRARRGAARPGAKRRAFARSYLARLATRRASPRARPHRSSDHRGRTCAPFLPLTACSGPFGDDRWQKHHGVENGPAPAPPNRQPARSVSKWLPPTKPKDRHACGARRNNTSDAVPHHGGTPRLAPHPSPRAAKRKRSGRVSPSTRREEFGANSDS